MYLKSIEVKNIRNLKSTELYLSKGINIFHGQNAQGKTNLLEAIYFCGVGRSHRTSSYKDLINFNENEAYIKSIVSSQYDIVDSINVYMKRSKKEISVNGQPIKKIIELFSTLFVIIFSPEDLDIVSAGPQIRRKFIDINLCQINPVYYYYLAKYHNILNQRNKLLKACKKKQSSSDTIDVWDDQLIQYGKKIVMYRAEYINSLANIVQEFHKKITNNKENLQIIYKPSVDLNFYEKKIKENLDRDILMGNTSVGIHKDDLSIFISDKSKDVRYDVRSFGSQGQKRSVSLSLKLSGIEYIKEKYEPPILLLDDVLSELDESRQRFLLQEIQSLQTILTCTGVEDVISKMSSDIDITLFKVDNGEITKER